MNLQTGIVRIENAGSVGAGFVVSEEGLVVTCAHILGVDRPEEVTITFPTTNESRVAKVIPEWWRSIEDDDVAILKIEGSLPKGASILPLSSAVGTQGHKITTFGYPDTDDIEGIWGVGASLGLGVKTKTGQPLLQVQSDEITRGFSGAPVLDQSLNLVIGMIVILATIDDSGRLGRTAFAVPTETLRAICPVLRVTDMCPYRNLDAFSEQDVSFFFGRARVVNQLVQSLKKQRRFLAVFGPSGCGKSSIVQAGLIPLLRKGQVPGSDRWNIITTRPTDHSFQSFIAALRDQQHTITTVVIDQFEELFVAYNETVNKAVVSELIELLDKFPHVNIIVVMRDDFYSSFVQQEALAKWLQQGLVNVSSILEDHEVLSMIRDPAYMLGLRFEQGLIETIIDDVLETEGYSRNTNRIGNSTILPLLEFTLTQLWERREEGTLKHDAYNRIGGVTGGLTQWADQVFYNFEEGLRPLVHRIFADLIYLGDEEQHIPDSRRRRELTRLIRNEGERENIREIIYQLVRTRLLVIGQDKETGQETVEIIHDALLREWGLLKQWIAEDRRFLLWHQRLQQRVQEWIETERSVSNGRDVYKLFGGLDLVESVRWLSTRKMDLSQQEQAFIQASQDRQEYNTALQRRALNRLRILAVTLLIFTLVTSVLAYWAEVNLQQAETARRLELAHALAAQANASLLRGQPDLSLLLSAKAYETDNDYETRDTLSTVLEQNTHLGKILHYSRIASKTAIVRTDDANQPGFALDPGGQNASSLLSDGNITSWNLATGTYNAMHLPFPVPPKGNSALSPTGKEFAYINPSGVWLWDIGASKPPELLSKNSCPTPTSYECSSVFAFSSNGKFLAVSDGLRDSISVWDLSSRQRISIVSNVARIVGRIALSSDGKFLAISACEILRPIANGGNPIYCGPGAIFLWNIVSGRLISNPLIGHQQDIRCLAFSQNGDILASGDIDGTILLWSTITQQLIGTPLIGHTSSVESLIFSPDNHLLASGGFDKSVRLWNVPDLRHFNSETGKFLSRPQMVFVGHQNSVSSILFTSDSRQIISSDEGNTVIIWNIVANNFDGKQTTDQTIPGSLRAFNSSRHIIAYLASLQGLSLYNIDTGATIALEGAQSEFIDASFSSDGRLLAGYDRKGSIDVWDMSAQKLVRHFTVPPDEIHVAFSPDGGALALWGGETEKRVILLDAINGHVLHQFMQEDRIGEIAFNPISHTIASCLCNSDSNQNTVSVWNEDTGQMVDQFTGSPHSVEILFSPDGKTLVSRSKDGTLTSWDMATKKALQLPFPRDEYAIDVPMAFSPDGKLLAIPSEYQSSATITLLDTTTYKPFVHPIAVSLAIDQMLLGSQGQLLVTENIGHGEVLDKISLLNIDPDMWVKKACSVANRNLTMHEWNQFVPGEPYSKVCVNLPG